MNRLFLMNKLFLLLVVMMFLGLFAAFAFADLKPLTECTVTNLTLTNAGTEYSHEIIPNSIYFAVKARTGSDFKYSWVAAASGTTYRTVPANSEYYIENGKFMNRRILYFQSAAAGLVLEIETCR